MADVLVDAVADKLVIDETPVDADDGDDDVEEGVATGAGDGAKKKRRNRKKKKATGGGATSVAAGSEAASKSASGSVVSHRCHSFLVGLHEVVPLTGPAPDKLPPFRGVKGFTNSYITSGQTDPPSIPVRCEFFNEACELWRIVRSWHRFAGRKAVSKRPFPRGRGPGASRRL